MNVKCMSAPPAEPSPTGPAAVSRATYLPVWALLYSRLQVSGAVAVCSRKLSLGGEHTASLSSASAVG